MFELFAENWDAVCLYMACQTQWIRKTYIPPMGGEVFVEWQGLNYQGVDVVINRTPQFKQSKDLELFIKLQIIESEARNLL